MNDWIEWAGGECPVAPDTRVDVGFRGGSTDATTEARYWIWGHAGGSDDIVRYRIADDVSATLAEREATHGSYSLRSGIARQLRDALCLHERDNGFSDEEEEALIHICTKLSRIANGNPHHADHWHDIAGYATLVADRLKRIA